MIELLASVPWQFLYDLLSALVIVALVFSVEHLARVLSAVLQELDRHREQLRALQALRQSQADRIALGLLELRPRGRR